MTQNPFDAFSKEYLADLLTPYGEVSRSFEVPGELKFIDLLFLPTPQNAITPEAIKPKVSGLLKQVISTPSVLEVYSGSPSENEIFTCITKLCWLRESIVRQSNRTGLKLSSRDYPKLWILANTLSGPIRKKCAVIQKPRISQGIYHFPNSILQIVMVSLKELPATPDTLWMRILARDGTQIRAIEEVLALPLNDDRRAPLLRMLCAWKIVTIETYPALFENPEATKMAYPQIFLDWEAATQERGEKIGEKRGEKIGEKKKALTIVLRLLRRQISGIDQRIEAVVTELSANQLEDLSEAVLDFSSLTDLTQWLSGQGIITP